MLARFVSYSVSLLQLYMYLCLSYLLAKLICYPILLEVCTYLLAEFVCYPIHLYY